LTDRGRRARADGDLRLGQVNTDYESVFVEGSAVSFTYTEELDVELWPTLEETLVFIDENAVASRTSA
jgi:hypothetical protein